MRAIDTRHLHPLEPLEVLVSMATRCVGKKKKQLELLTQYTRGRRRGCDCSTFLGNKVHEADPPVEAITETDGEEKMHPDLGEWRHEAEGKKHGWRTWKLSHGTQNKGLNMSVRRTVLKPASQRRWPNAAA